MTTEPHPVGAVSREPVAWHAIQWQDAHENVRRLQARIVKATQAGRWGKDKALQRLLTHSHSGKLLAVRRVTDNHEGLLRNRVLKRRHKALERLEPCTVKAVCTVLRGGGGGNAAPLPDP